MGMLERFFGKRDPENEPVGALAANAAIENPLSLQVLFAEPPRLDPAKLTRTLRKYHPSMAHGILELDQELSDKGTPFGLVGWENHVIRIVGFDAPMPTESVELCVQPAHYGPDLKASARAHKAHILLYYAGYESSPLEQYVALAAVVGVLASHGGIVVLNESACTSFPAAALMPGEGDMIEQLHSLPIPVLYCGFVKYNVEGVDGVWMRTYGANLLGLPDLATLATGHEEGEKFFYLFSNVFTYLLNTGASFGVGHTMQVGDDLFMRLRAPAPEEYFLESEGELFVAEMTSADDINRPDEPGT